MARGRSTMSGWDDPETAMYYEAFCRSHSRYARANAALVAHAFITPGMRLLDLAAGTGRTAQAALRRLGAERQRVVRRALFGDADGRDAADHGPPRAVGCLRL